MKRLRHHQPPPAPVVSELVRAGVSFETAMAMERWKAQEVLELLRPIPAAGRRPEGQGRPQPAW